MAIDKVVDSNVLNGYFSDIADAIRDKDGTQNTYTPAQMPQAIEDIPSGGGMDENFAALLRGTASGDLVVRGVESLNAAAIGFSNNGNDNGLVTSLEFPDLILAKSSSGVVHSGFMCYAYGANRLESLKLPKCTDLFIHNLAQNAYGNTFTNLTTLYAPVLTSLGGSLRAAKLSHIAFPELTSVAGSMFTNCTSMTYADIGLISTVQDALFAGCSSLTAVALRNNTAATLNNTNAFYNTPIASGTGYIYVPRDLIATYEAATNWSTFAGQFRALEDYTDDGTITGEFIPPTA